MAHKDSLISQKDKVISSLTTEVATLKAALKEAVEDYRKASTTSAQHEATANELRKVAAREKEVQGQWFTLAETLRTDTYKIFAAWSKNYPQPPSMNVRPISCARCRGPCRLPVRCHGPSSVRKQLFP